MLATLPFSFNFSPLDGVGPAGGRGWALYLGIKAKKTRTGTPNNERSSFPKSPSGITAGDRCFWL